MELLPRSFKTVAYGYTLEIMPRKYYDGTTYCSGYLYSKDGWKAYYLIMYDVSIPDKIAYNTNIFNKTQLKAIKVAVKRAVKEAKL